MPAADRIHPEDIDALMARVTFINDVAPNNTTSTFVHAFLDGQFHLASGHSACVSKANFDPEMGLDIARRDAKAKAIAKLWELEGYALYRATHPAGVPA
jgi:hypothetical protein